MNKKQGLSGVRREITLIVGTTLLSACVVLVSLAVSKYKQQATGYAFINGHLVYVTTPPPDPRTLPEVIARIKAYERRLSQLRQWAALNGVQLRDKNSPAVSTVDFLSFSNDSRFLASNHADGTVRLWDVQRGKLLRRFNGVRGAILSPDGRTIACMWRGGAINLRSTRTGRVLRTLWWRDKLSQEQREMSADYNFIVYRFNNERLCAR
jgi:WD40 repeat protein